MLYTNAQHADMQFLYSFQDENATALSSEYQRQSLERREPSGQVFAKVHCNLSERGAFMSSAHFGFSRRNVDKEQVASEAAHANPLISTPQVTYETGLSQNAVWQSTNEEHLYSFHLLRICTKAATCGGKHLDLQFCRWLLYKIVNGPNILFCFVWTYEATFTSSGVNNLHNTGHWRSLMIFDIHMYIYILLF